MRKWIPKDMEWFLADLIEQFAFANDDKLDVWVNTILIKASSPEEAYQKALKIGEDYNETYTNTDGVEVTKTFRGLRNLYLVYEDLEDGAELVYQEHDDLTDEEVSEMVTPKSQLSAIKWHGGEQIEATHSQKEGELP